MNSKTLLWLVLLLTLCLGVSAQSYSSSVVSMYVYDETGTVGVDYVGIYNQTLSTVNLRNVTGINSTINNSIGNTTLSIGNITFSNLPVVGTIKTMSFWIKPYANSQYLMSGTTGSVGETYFDGGNGFQISAPQVGATSLAVSATNTSYGNWVHVLAVANGSTSRVYYNGVAQSVTITGSPTHFIVANQTFMMYRPTQSLYFKGNFDNLCLYNTTLNSSEALEVYQTEITYGQCLTTVSPSGSAINITNSVVASPVLALTTQNYELNISYNGSINLTSATFFWNNTAYSPTLTQSVSSITNDSYSISLTIPDVVNGTVVSSYWAYNYSYTNGTLIQANSSTQNQTILNILIGNCTSNVTTNNVLNITIRDSVGLGTINAASLLNITAWFNGLSRTFNLSYPSSSNPRVCLYPPTFDFNYTLTMGMSATGYYSTAFIDFGTISNLTLNKTAYMTNTTNASSVTYNVVDSSENPLQGLIVQTYQYDIGTGVLTLVNSLVTDISGQGVAFLNLNNYFVWRIYDNASTLLLTEGPQYLPLTTTSHTFIIGGNTTTGLTNWITVYGLSCTVTNSTSPLGTTTVWNATNSNLTNYCFNLFNVSGGNMVLFNQSCSTNLTGSLFLPAYNDSSWLAFPTMTANGSTTTYILWCSGESPLSFNTYNQTTPLFGLEGVFWALILLVLLMTIGFAGQGAEYISMLLIIGWTALVSLFNLIPWGYATFIGIAAFLIVWIMGMRRER